MLKKKIIFNLTPDDNPADKFAVARSDTTKGRKADFYRTCFLAGVLLHKIDPRLPELLTTILDDKVTEKSLIGALQMLQLATDIPQTSVTSQKLKSPEPEDAVKNAKAMFLGD